MSRGPGPLGQQILTELRKRSFAELRDLLPENVTDKDYQRMRKAAVSLADAGLIEMRRTYMGKREAWKLMLALPGRMPSAE